MISVLQAVVRALVRREFPPAMVLRFAQDAEQVRRTLLEELDPNLTRRAS